MTVIRPNSISGITSITAQANEINVFRSDGTLAGLQLNGVNFNNTSGISTLAALNVTGNVSVGGTLTYEDVTNIDSVGMITARTDITLGDSIIHLGDTDTKMRFPANDTVSFETGGSERLRIDSTGSLFAGGTVLAVSDLNWSPNTYQRPHILSGITGGNPSDGALVLASPETNPSNTRIGALLFACKTSSTSGVSNSGLKSYIQGGTNSNVSDAWKTGGYMSFYTRPDNGQLGERLRIHSNGNLLLGTTNSTTVGTVNRNLIVGSTTNADEVAVTLNVMEGTNNRRVKFFLDDDDGVYGLDTTSSTGTAQFVIRHATSEKFRIDGSGDITASHSGLAVNIFESTDNHSRLRIKSSDASLAQLEFADQTDADAGEIRYDHGNDRMTFHVGSNVERFRIDSDGELLSNCNNNGQIIHTFSNLNDTASSSAMTVEHHFNFNRTSGAMSLSGARIVAGKEREWVGAAANQDGYFAVHTTADETSAEKMRISSGGIMTRPYQPAFSAQGLTSPVDSSEGYTGQLSNYMQVMECNIGGHYKTSGTDVGKFVAPVAGNYFFSAMILFRLRSGSNANGEVSFYKNNSNISARSLGYTYLVGTNDHDSIHITSIISLAAGDKVHFGAHACSSGGDWYWGSGLGNFHGYLIG